MTPNTDNVNNVRVTREAKGLSREGLAFKAGITVRTVERVEAGHVLPHRVTRRAIAVALGVTVADLGWPDADLEAVGA